MTSPNDAAGCQDCKGELPADLTSKSAVVAHKTGICPACRTKRNTERSRERQAMTTQTVQAAPTKEDARKLRVVREDDAKDLVTWRTGCEDLPDGYKVPFGYEVDFDGVYLVKETQTSAQGVKVAQRIRVTYAPLLPVGVFIDPAGDQVLELIWPDRGRWVKRAVPRSTAKSGRKLISALGDAGLPAVDADAKLVERWLAAAETLNREVIPRRILARWLGWQKDGTFVTSAGTPHQIEPTYDEQSAALAAHKPCGSLDAWRDAIKSIEDYPVAQMALYAGFAAPLLDRNVLNIDSFTVDFSGRSTRGKTTAAKIGLSVWADPSEKADGMFSWRTTMIAIEKRLNLVRGMPVVLDETRVVKAPEVVDQVLYQVPKNRGQARGGGWPSMLPWSTVVISTGEQSALSFTSHAGASARVLALMKPPFGSGGPDNGRAAIDVGRAIEDNHGVAGPAFIERLQQQLAERAEGDDGVSGRDQLRARHRVLAEAYKGTSDMSGRRAPMVAALALAAHLAHEWGIVPFAPPADEIWLDLFAAEDPTDNRPEMAMDVVREYIASHGEDLWEPGSNRSQPNAGWIGRRITVDGVATVAILPEHLRDALKRANYTLDAVLAGWRDLGYLHESGSGRGAHLPIRTLDKGKARMCIFAPSALRSGAGEDGEAGTLYPPCPKCGGPTRGVLLDPGSARCDPCMSHVQVTA